MRHCKPNSRIDHYHELELQSLKEMSVHNDIAFAAAMYYCMQHEICPPPWVVAGGAKLMIELLKREKSQKRGRAAGRIARYRQDLWDFERYDAVGQIRELRERFKREAETLEQYPEYKKDYPHVAKAQKWLANETFECASMSLRGSFAAGGPVAVKKSYRRVKEAMRSGSGAHRYHLMFGDFVFKIGLDWPGAVRPGTKLAPFWELTP